MKLRREETGEIVVSETEFAEICELDVIFNPNKGIKFSTVGISRPGIMLAGYAEYFAPSRVQVFGKNEVSYLATLTAEARKERVTVLFKKHVPCLIVSRGLKLTKDVQDVVEAYGTPIFSSSKVTAELISDVMNYLNDLLVPNTSQHGVLLDVFGTGVMITGESGIGKSETALELVHRGHRLVSDDIVELKEIKGRLFGSSPKITNGMLEVRGLGIIDIQAIYGIGAVLGSKRLELIINLERWVDGKFYDRIGAALKYKNILGIEIPEYTIPIIAGRNLAVIIEVAVRNFRLNQHGYNALQEINKRMED